MLWLPAFNVEVESWALPLLRVARPISFEPSENFTWPVGAPPTWLVTVAVRVIAVPYVPVVREAANAIVGGVIDTAAACPKLPAPSLAVTVHSVGVAVFAVVSLNDEAIVVPRNVPFRFTV